MNKLSKYFFVLIILSLLFVIGYRYYDYIYKRDFLIYVNIPCDPITEECFVSDCQSEIDCDNSPYKKIEIMAYDVPKCLEEHSCKNFYCSVYNNCNVTHCSDDTLIEGEKCIGINNKI